MHVKQIIKPTCIRHTAIFVTFHIGIIKRIRNFIPKESLLTLYRTLVEPYLRYCNIVWGQCNETLKDKLQTLQYKAARTIAKIRYDGANHMKLLCDFGWISVRNLINFDLAVFMYNTQRELAPDTIKDLFQTVDVVHSYKTRAATDGKLHAYCAYKPRYHTETHLFFRC